MRPPCAQFVPGYGDTTARVHVVGDHPGSHGGIESGIPFTDRGWSARFFDVLERAGLVEMRDGADPPLHCKGTYLSYLHQCVPVAATPTRADYERLEPYFDAELRAITAHVLLPVGDRATRHVLETYTARPVSEDEPLSHLTGRELSGSGWLVLPLGEPERWSDDDAEDLVEALRSLLASDYRQTSDLGRFRADGTPYFVR